MRDSRWAASTTTAAEQRATAARLVKDGRKLAAQGYRLLADLAEAAGDRKRARRHRTAAATLDEE